MPIGARKDSTFYAVSIIPDVCLTPMGGAMVPVPYAIFSNLAGSELVAATVNFNHAPAYQWDHSLAPPVVGDEPGTGGGVKSGVNVGKVWAPESSTHVRAEGRKIVRHGDRCWMNAKR
jgi:uncharacterized Zn-binding protein involved in type VI secretion